MSILCLCFLFFSLPRAWHDTIAMEDHVMTMVLLIMFFIVVFFVNVAAFFAFLAPYNYARYS